MGNHEVGFVDDLVAEEQEIQIQCTRSVVNAAGAVAAERALDAQEFGKELVGRERCFERDNGVEEARLVRVAHGRGAVETRAAAEASESIEMVRGEG